MPISPVLRRGAVPPPVIRRGRTADVCDRAFVDVAPDVGCGTDNLAVELASYSGFTSIEAFDLSQAYIADAKAGGTDPHINFPAADASAIPFPDSTFDLTLSMLVLAFIPEPQCAVREMVRVTRPGGTVAACMWNLRGDRGGSARPRVHQRLDHSFLLTSGVPRIRCTSSNSGTSWPMPWLDSVRSSSRAAPSRFVA
jgi:ubiquinone/menaquinone biosynthesis C-methylase UbiE